MIESFWTIMIKDKFLNYDLSKKDNNNICEAIKFSNEESCRKYFDDLRKDKPFKIVKASYILEVID